MSKVKFLGKSEFGTNFSVVTKYGLSLPAKKKKPKAIDLSPVQFQYKLQLAKKYFVYGFRSFRIGDLKKRYNLTQGQSKEMYDILMSDLQVFRNNHYSNAPKPVLVEPKRITLSLKDRLDSIRLRYSTEIGKHGEQVKIDEGFIYLVENPSFPGWVKVGMTVDYEKRLKSYNIPNDPHQAFSFIKVRWVENRRKRESEKLELFAEFAEQFRGEWFKIETEQALVLFGE